jgi:hypothetical protein
MPHPFDRTTLRALAALGVALSSGGCSSSAPSTRSSSDNITSVPSDGTWATIGFGIGGTDVGTGNDVLVAYGGYTATDQDSRAWALQLISARLGGLGVGHVYAARGPEDASYAAREIGNSKLAAQLAGQAAPADFIVVVAHSSGAFVADELFTQVGADVMAKMVYFDLDGGSWALTTARVAAMKAVYFVNSKDAQAGESHNASAIRSLYAEFPASHLFTVDADGSGCDVGATWCLHDTLITTHPHNPTTFDLALDYEDFSGRQVVTSYIDQAVADGVLADSSGDAGTIMPADDAGSVTVGANEGGPACNTDGDCNPNTDGSGQICVGGTCVAGCNADWECSGAETCASGQCQ